jgi:hypothetical protein
MGVRLKKGFYTRMIATPFGAVIVLALVQGITEGFGKVVSNWQTYLGTFIFISVVLALSIFLVVRRLEGFFANIKKRPILLIVGLFINLILLIQNKPKFILIHHSFLEYLPYLIIVSIAWILFPLIVSKKFDGFKGIPETPKLLLGLFSYMVTLFSILLLSMVDVISLFLLF